MALRVLFFGMEGIFSRAPLIELINASMTVCAIVVPRPSQSQPSNDPLRLIPPPRAPESDVPLLFQPRDLNIIGIAWNAGIPVYETDDLDQALEALAALKPGVIAVACFPLLLPERLITRFPALNLHPSLLPAYRGPAPLFWVFHDGLEHAGVTVHLMEKKMDAGAIVAQARVPLPDGIGYGEAEHTLSDRAAQLLVNALRAIDNKTLESRAQPNAAAPRAPNPTDRDYVVTPNWTARRAFNFIRGIADWKQPIVLEMPDRRFTIRAAIAFHPARRLDQPLTQIGNEWHIQMQDGTLICGLAPL